MMTLRAKFDGRVFVPEGPIDLPAGSVMEIQIKEINEDAGSAAALRRVMHQPPHLSHEDVEALGRAMDEGRLPVSRPCEFDEKA